MGAVGQASALGLFWRRYRVSIIFPTLALSAIFADYSHTQKFKASLSSKPKEELTD